MNRTMVIEDDPLPRRALTQVVERRDGDRTELLTLAQAQRYDLMVEAVDALVVKRVTQPEACWVPEMAPLRKVERRGVLRDATRRIEALTEEGVLS